MTYKSPSEYSALEFMGQAVREFNRARELFPENNVNLIALMEEVGELAKAMLEEPADNVWKEAVQVAAVAMRCAIEGDVSTVSARKSNQVDLFGDML